MWLTLPSKCPMICISVTACSALAPESSSLATSCCKFPEPSSSNAGARRWIARIMISWGILTVFVGLVHTAHQFYAARFLLGATEAGFFPDILVYHTHWFRHQDRAAAIAAFMAAIPVSNIFGSP